MLTGVVTSFGCLVRFNCACNSGVDDVSRLQGCETKAEGLEPYHESCMDRGCIFFELVFYYNNLTVLPCFLDGFPTSLTRCGTLDGVRNRWGFKVNFVEEI